MRREIHQSFAFLRGIEPASRVDSFETTMSQITDGDIVVTLEETGKKELEGSKSQFKDYKLL